MIFLLDQWAVVFVGLFHHIRLNSKFDTIDFEDIIPIGQRLQI